MPTSSLQSRDDGEMTEKASMQIAQASCEVRNSSEQMMRPADELQAVIDSLKEALAASEKRADQQALRRVCSVSTPIWAYLKVVPHLSSMLVRAAVHHVFLFVFRPQLAPQALHSLEDPLLPLESDSVISLFR